MSMFETYNFEKLKLIETPEKILDSAIKSAKKDAINIKLKNKEKQDLARNKAKISTLSEILKEKLKIVVKDFPDLNKLNPFYINLLETRFCIKDIKRALAHISWTRKKINEFKGYYKTKPHKYREFLGKTASLMDDISKEIQLLNEVILFMKKFPIIKEVPTIALVGLPNVGKSTFLKTFTDSNPEIKDYAFTTKKLQIGYVKEILKLQIIDCPGMLDRPFEKMNYIEKQAYLAIKYLTKDIFFIIDPLQEIKEQINLLKRIFKLKPEARIYVIINKIDTLECNLNNTYNKTENISSDEEINQRYLQNEILKEIMGTLERIKTFENQKIKKIFLVSLQKQINTENIKKEMEKIYFLQLKEMIKNEKN